MGKIGIVVGMLVVLLIAGCAAQTAPPTSQLSPLDTPEKVFIPFSGGPSRATIEITPTVELPSSHAGKLTLTEAIEAAKADLALRLGIKPEEIEVIRAAREEMPIQDIKCGKIPEGEITPPGFVIGYEVVLLAQGKTYTYRGKGGCMKLCEPSVINVEEEQADIVRKTIEDLASRLGVEKTEIEVVSAESVIWSDASLGCPEPGKMYAQVLTPGYRIVLRVKGQIYEYHTDKREHFVLCPQERSRLPLRK